MVEYAGNHPINQEVAIAAGRLHSDEAVLGYRQLLQQQHQIPSHNPFATIYQLGKESKQEIALLRIACWDMKTVKFCRNQRQRRLGQE